MPLKRTLQLLAIAALILALVAVVWLLPRWLTSPQAANWLQPEN